MAMKISHVVDDIAKAVQNANFILDQMAAEMYLKQGYQKGTVAEDEDMLIPIVHKIQLSDSGSNKIQMSVAGNENVIRHVEVPVTALIHHGTMQLENVDVTLRFKADREADGALMVDLKPDKNSEDSSDIISEMKLHFQRAEPPEGMARIDMKHYQKL